MQPRRTSLHPRELAARMLVLAQGAWVCAASLAFAEAPAQFRVPDGFRVRLYAGDGLAHDIYSMTVDAQ